MGSLGTWIQLVMASLSYDKNNINIRQIMSIITTFLAQTKYVFDIHQAPIVHIHITKYKHNRPRDLCTMIFLNVKFRRKDIHNYHINCCTAAKRVVVQIMVNGDCDNFDSRSYCFFVNLHNFFEFMSFQYYLQNTTVVKVQCLLSKQDPMVKWGIDWYGHLFDHRFHINRERLEWNIWNNEFLTI